jgi:hypothetical protein
MVSWKELTASFRRLRIVQEALGQLKILLLLFIFGQENLNSTYPHETAKSLFLQQGPEQQLMVNTKQQRL